MKKLILALAICLIPAKVMSANFVDTLGLECGKIMLNINTFIYPEAYNDIIKRNSQFEALDKCIETYKKTGGSIEYLNERYNNSSIFSEIFYDKCMIKTISKKDYKDKDLNSCTPLKIFVFSRAWIDVCRLYNKHDAYHLNSFLKEICETEKQQQDSIDL